MRTRWFLILCMAISSLYADWENIRISKTLYYAGDPSLAVYGDTIAIAYETYAYGNDEVVVQYSANHGFSFGQPIRITTNDSASWRPKIAVRNQGFDFIFEDTRSGKRAIYAARLEAATVSFPLKLNTGNAAAAYPSLAATPFNLFVSWEDSRFGNEEIYARTGQSLAWSTEKRLTNHDSTSWNGSLFWDTVQGKLHAVFFDFRTGNDEVYYVVSHDSGNTWTTPVNISNSAKNSWEPRVAAYHGVVRVVWQEFVDITQSYEVFFSEKVGEQEWTAPAIMSPSGADSKLPTISMDASGTAIAWEDYRDGNDEIYVLMQRSGTSGWNEQRVTINGSDSYGADVSIQNGKVFVTWFDYRDSVDQIYFACGSLPPSVEKEVNVKQRTSFLTAFPNPFNTKVQFHVSTVSKEIPRLLIRDIGGRVVEDISVHQAHPVWTPIRIAKGMYWAELQTRKGRQCISLLYGP